MNNKERKMKSKTVFVINDFFSHGGHIKSFLAQFNVIKENLNDYRIVCSLNGYIEQHKKILDFIDYSKVSMSSMNSLRRSQFSYSLYKILKKELSNGDILHIYSYDCYFSASLAKQFYDDVIVVNSVMGGPNPFPCLPSTDLYIAVSKEQEQYATKHIPVESKKCNIAVIKNRITLEENLKDQEKSASSEKIILIVSRFDEGLKVSLERISQILFELPRNYRIVLAGKGTLLDEYKLKFIDYDNIDFIGYSKDLSHFQKSAVVVLGMGRSILEFMIEGIPAILIGHDGIENLQNIEHVKFASNYNFAGREILENININQTIKIIIQYMNNNVKPDNSITNLLKLEYDVTYFNDKYQDLLINTYPSKVSFYHLLNEYLNYNLQRLKR